MAKISLTRYISEAHQAGGLPRQQAWPITIVAVGEDIDSEVFVYHVQKDGDPLVGDIFEAVASPQQIYEVPKTPGAATSENTQVPYYRRDTVEFLARSAQEANDIWRIINEDVEILVRDFNAGATLLGVERIVYSEETPVTQDLQMSPPVRHQLSYHPCGVAAITGDVQRIESPFTPLLDGWLPVSQAPVGFVPPAGALLFYNIDQDEDLKALFPLREPVDGHTFLRNGIALPYGVVYTITEKTIWWQEFDPALLPAYERRVWQAPEFNMPWPPDYVNRSNPGETRPDLVLQIFT